MADVVEIFGADTGDRPNEFDGQVQILRGDDGSIAALSQADYYKFRAPELSDMSLYEFSALITVSEGRHAGQEDEAEPADGEWIGDSDEDQRFKAPKTRGASAKGAGRPRNKSYGFRPIAPQVMRETKHLGLRSKQRTPQLSGRKAKFPGVLAEGESITERW